MNIRRIRQVLHYGWQHAGQIAASVQQGMAYRIKIFLDIVHCYRTYRMWSNQYLKEKFHLLSRQERESIGLRYREAGLKRDEWQKDFVENRKFLVKYGNIRYELANLREVRNKAYMKFFNTGSGLMVENNVNISRQHYLHGSIKIGKNVLFAKNVFIDYSGEVVIGNDVKFSNGAILESHTHPLFSDPSIPAEKAIPTKVVIEDGVCLGSNCIILDSCTSIGRNARIAAGAVVRNSIPPYAVVVGNPGKIVGFVYTPVEVREYEEKMYSENDRISVAQYEKDYEKLFLNRISEIRTLLKN